MLKVKSKILIIIIIITMKIIIIVIISIMEIKIIMINILRISPYSVRMRENADQDNSEYGHFLCSDSLRANAVFRKD